MLHPIRAEKRRLTLYTTQWNVSYDLHLFRLPHIFYESITTVFESGNVIAKNRRKGVDEVF